MIFDRIENSGLYFPSGTLFSVGFDFIKSAMRDLPPDGKHELKGGAYAMIQTYQTAPAPDKKPESHKKFADIQALLSGREVVGFQPTNGLETAVEYREDNDVCFYKNSPEENYLLLQSGLFAVFFPVDAHKPGCCVAAPDEVRKLVVKIPV
ncbi:MAG: YhcH/YjgK/YiaL family protein [Nitrospinae bacterium]|nr:YhcH/YjgK/YiaL family protein [Nitrospinota bacterium]